MARGYRKSGRQASLPQVVDKSQVLEGRVSLELPFSVVEIIEGVSQEAEQLAGEAGLLIMKAVMDAEVASLAGPKSKHDPDRTATRWTPQAGYVVLAGKKVPVIKPRVRAQTGEVNLRSYERFQSAPRRQTSIYQKLVNGISTRKYKQAIDDFTEGYGITRSAVSRQMVEATRGALQKLCELQIDELGRPLAVLMIDGKQLHGECVIIALGVDLQGKKHTLGLVQGATATENSVVVQQFLDDLIERGLDAARPMLIVLDGRQGLAQGSAGHVRRSVAGAALPDSQASQRPRAVAEGISAQRGSTHAHGVWDDTSILRDRAGLCYNGTGSAGVK
jgi:hypothetical protein